MRIYSGSTTSHYWLGHRGPVKRWRLWAPNQHGARSRNLWERTKDRLSVRVESVRRTAADNGVLVNELLWSSFSGACRHDLAGRYGKHHKRFVRWTHSVV